MRILIVEDEALVAMDLEEIVEGMGHNVCGTAARLGEAIRMAQEFAPQLVLMDVHLASGDSGLKAGEMISSGLGIPVVFITASVEEVASACPAFPVAGLIAKPCSEPLLRQAIASLKGQPPR
ncbi:response regulator [Arenibaculum pallidiluteum]|uniref:response regulator n=1 Tax=Arenibaculum pallidiluteum TaxID=2812559 RepID=UPI001A95DD6E|nr:response regulator [Arenibaculum pallidiluteum]